MREAMKTQEDSRQTFWTHDVPRILLVAGILVALGLLELTRIEPAKSAGSVSVPATK